MENGCSVASCNRPEFFRTGWCSAHYERVRQHGTPQADKPIGTANGAATKFYKEVVLTYEGNDCLLWPFVRTPQGYAKLLSKSACRMLCEETKGPPPTPDHDAAHSCGKGHEGCVTKGHLSWKTKVENAADRIIHGTSLRGSDHPRAKLTEAQIVKMRSLRWKVPAKELAAMVGVSEGHARKIVRIETWTWLEDAS